MGAKAKEMVEEEEEEREKARRAASLTLDRLAQQPTSQDPGCRTESKMHLQTWGSEETNAPVHSYPSEVDIVESWCEGAEPRCADETGTEYF